MITLKPVAAVENQRKDLTDDFWGKTHSIIVLNDEFPLASLKEIHTFSHLEIIFYFHKVPENKIETGARHPRNNPAFPQTGIFAQRGKNRPNRLGLTTVKLINHQGRSLEVTGLDCIDGTPVLDIKPVMQEFLPAEPVIQPEWSHQLMTDYWK